MLKYGTHTFVWIDEWTTEKGNQAIRSAAEVGFDFIEVSLANPEAFDPSAFRTSLQVTGMDVTVSLVLPDWAHMPEHPHEARQYLMTALDKTEALGSKYLCGCIAFALGRFTGSPATREERQVVIDTLGEVAEEASTRGICLGLEVVNRYESHLYNTLGEARETLAAVGANNLKLHVDTCHMIFEENGLYRPLVDCAEWLGYVHLSENHRGRLGTGTVNWDDVFRGLAHARYTGPLVVKCFAAVNPALAGAIKLWRPPQEPPQVLASEGLKFIRSYADRYGL